ncbi:uncharacterized protein LOC144782674 [Lissotriton helveticus]
MDEEGERRREAASLFARAPGKGSSNIIKQGKPTNDPLNEQLRKYERLKKQESSKWWEATSLQDYVDKEMVPRGLRIYITPSHESLNPKMLDDWSLNSARSSKNMLDILIKYAWEDRDVILQQLKDMDEEFGKCNDQETIKKFKDELKNRLKKHEDDIKYRKQRKLHCDCGDYESGRILTYSPKYDYLYNQQDTTSITVNQTLTESDHNIATLTSGSETDTSQQSTSTALVIDISKKPANFLQEFRVLRTRRKKEVDTTHQSEFKRNPTRGRPRGRARGRGDRDRDDSSSSRGEEKNNKKPVGTKRGVYRKRK